MSSFITWDSLRKFDSRAILKSGSLKPVVFSSDPLNLTSLHTFSTASLGGASIGVVGKAGATKIKGTVTLVVYNGKGKKTSYKAGSVRGCFCCSVG